MAEKGKTALLLDSTAERVSDNYFMYAEATVVEAKKLVLEVRSAGTPLEAVREQLRAELVHAMRWGHSLVVRMTNTAADFAGSYCAPDAFPVELFDAAAVPAASSIIRKKSVPIQPTRTFNILIQKRPLVSDFFYAIFCDCFSIACARIKTKS